MSGFDQNSLVVSVNLGFANPNLWSLEEQSKCQIFFNIRHMESKFKQFIKDFHFREEYVYREMMKETGTIVVDLIDLHTFDEEMYELLCKQPFVWVPFLERCALEVSISLKYPFDQVFLSLRNLPVHTKFREVTAMKIFTLVNISGIVVHSSQPRPRIAKCVCYCSNCSTAQIINFPINMRPPKQLPLCPRKPHPGQPRCISQPMTILPEESTFIDQQILKLQEPFEESKSGEVPRTLQICLERHLVNKCISGQFVRLTGCLDLLPSSSSLTNPKTRYPYFYVFGIEIQQDQGRLQQTALFDRDEFLHHFSSPLNVFTASSFSTSSASSSSSSSSASSSSSSSSSSASSSSSLLYENISSLVAPHIMGNQDVKKAIVLQLFGGVRRNPPDGTVIRGDIHTLLLGDPSVAKSVFLQQAQQLSPVSILTSGKGASAAGLTAAVLRDPISGEFRLEGGALVLADGGLVCIDEFDKMFMTDRVALHEAMEQQTISIAKAGITSILRAQTSVLAAANPIFGRYDDLKTFEEQIDFHSTLLSRFDFVFLLRDLPNSKQDEKMAKHILSIHINRPFQHLFSSSSSSSSSFSSFPVSSSSSFTHSLGQKIQQLREYIAYTRKCIDPCLNEEASNCLRQEYIRLRNMSSHSSFRITVRHLEALIRITEAYARLCSASIATIEHAKEAIRLFGISTLEALSGNGLSQSFLSSNFTTQVRQAEETILTRIAPQSEISLQRLKVELLRLYNLAEFQLALSNLRSRGIIRFLKQGMIVQRIK